MSNPNKFKKISTIPHSLHSVVYARHGRELMGLKSPVPVCRQAGVNPVNKDFLILAEVPA